MRITLSAIATVLLTASIASAWGMTGMGCINTLENGQKKCYGIQSSTSCDGGGNSKINGVKVVKEEIAEIKSIPRSNKKVCIGRRSGEQVPYK